MAVTNSVCISINNCNSLVVEDTSDWDTVDPSTDIASTDIVVELDGVVTTLNFTGYAEDRTITPSDIGQSDNFEDGIYKITVIWTNVDTVTTYSLVDHVLQDCTISCQIDHIMLDISNDTCTDCRSEKIKKAMCLITRHHALCAALICNNITQAESLLSWLQTELVNSNCKNC